jgi:hypothetical protein
MLLSQYFLKRAITSVFIYNLDFFKFFLLSFFSFGSIFIAIIAMHILELLITLYSLQKKNLKLKLSQLDYSKRIAKWSVFRISHITKPLFKYSGIALLTMVFFILLLKLTALKASISIIFFITFFSIILSFCLTLLGSTKALWNAASTEFGIINCLLSPNLTNKEIVKRSQKLTYEKTSYLLLLLTNTCIFLTIILGLYKHFNYLAIILLLWISFTPFIKQQMFSKSLKSYNEKILTIPD